MCRSLNTTLFILFLLILIYIHNSNLKHFQTNVDMKIIKQKSSSQIGLCSRMFLFWHWTFYGSIWNLGLCIIKLVFKSHQVILIIKMYWILICEFILWYWAHLKIMRYDLFSFDCIRHICEFNTKDVQYISSRGLLRG